MGLLDGILSQLSGNASVDALAAKVGLSPQEVKMAVAALAHAHKQPGNTVSEASQQTGLPQDKLSQIVGHLGGENTLGSIASMLHQQGASQSGGQTGSDGGGDLIGSLSKML